MKIVFVVKIKVNLLFFTDRIKYLSLEPPANYFNGNRTTSTN